MFSGLVLRPARLADAHIDNSPNAVTHMCIFQTTSCEICNSNYHAIENLSVGGYRILSDAYRVRASFWLWTRVRPDRVFCSAYDRTIYGTIDNWRCIVRNQFSRSLNLKRWSECSRWSTCSKFNSDSRQSSGGADAEINSASINSGCDPFLTLRNDSHCIKRESPIIFTCLVGICIALTWVKSKICTREMMLVRLYSRYTTLYFFLPVAPLVNGMQIFERSVCTVPYCHMYRHV